VNGKYGGLVDIYQSLEHGARPPWNLRPPGGEHPGVQPRSAHARAGGLPKFGLGAEHAAACRYVITDDLGSEEERVDGARSRSSEPAVVQLDTWPQILSGRGALTHWDGGSTMIHAMDIEGAVMNRLLCCRSSDSDGRSLHRWTSSLSLDRDNMPGRVTRLIRMEWEEGHWLGAVGPS
jgi:hypothetical protein